MKTDITTIPAKEINELPTSEAGHLEWRGGRLWWVW